MMEINEAKFSEKGSECGKWLFDREPSHQIHTRVDSWKVSTLFTVQNLTKALEILQPRGRRKSFFFCVSFFPAVWHFSFSLFLFFLLFCCSSFVGTEGTMGKMRLDKCEMRKNVKESNLT
jgi:hypothetical protein